ncbi:hypothetical protein D8I24_0290 (plasmid) [Cupriavidus necator H850]|nr:hypothetical protein D8I24_0290 [Cupriavidus necator H850]
MLGYPKDDSLADFTGSDVLPIAFGAIWDAWNRVN